MKIRILKLSNSFRRDQRGGVAVIFAFAAIPMLSAAGVAVDYMSADREKVKLQSGADAAALQIATQLSQYYNKNGSYPSNTALANYQRQANSAVATQTSNVGSVTAANIAVCTPTSGQCTATINGVSTSLSNGQVAIKATGSRTRLFGGLSLAPVSLAATSMAGITTKTTTTTAPSPSSVTLQFQYAKGAYYKVVTLWVTPVGATTPLAIVTWTYQPTNLSVVAVPPPAINAILVANSGFPSHPVDTGIGVVTTAWNTANIAAVGATVNQSTSQITFSKAYDNLYMTLDAVDQQCAPGQVYVATTQAASQNNQAWYNSWYDQSGTVTETVGCQTPAKGSTAKPLTTWSLHVSTDPKAEPSSLNSDFIFKNGVEMPANQVISLASAFPCPSDPTPGQTATNYYAWESMDPKVGDRDFFFTMTTACSVGNYTQAASSTRTTTVPSILR